MSSRLSRITDLMSKAWSMGLDLLRHPLLAPRLAFEILFHRVHAGELLRLRPLQPWLRKCRISTVIDAGAHEGEFSSAIRVLLPDAQILAFEPQKERAVGIEKRVGGAMQVFPFAVGNSQRRARFFQSTFSKSSSLLPMAEQHREAFPWTQDTEAIEVEVRRLDDVVRELDMRPEILLKIDVQGAELELLEGAVLTLEDVRIVLVELSLETMYEGEPTFDDVYSFLSRHGFRYVGSAQQLLDPDQGRPLQQDALFLRG